MYHAATTTTIDLAFHLKADTCPSRTTQGKDERFFEMKKPFSEKGNEK